MTDAAVKGLSFEELAQVASADGQPVVDLLGLLAGPWPGPVTAGWATEDPVTVLGVARAARAYRETAPVVIEAGDAVARMAGVEPAATTTDLAAVARQGEPALVAPGAEVTVARHTGTGVDLVDAVALLRRSHELVLLAGWDDTVAGIADVVVVPVCWTEASVRDAATRIDQWHRRGEQVHGRVVVAAHAAPAEPGLESRARRWFTQLPVYPVPTDPATRSPGRSWTDLQPTTQTALANLAGGLIHTLQKGNLA
ncbi:MAG: hypothetical protein Q4G45_09865 [Actinomycetia bacterium]|nr:hypothetical protein [Actinomycetes bacterium]